MLEEGLSYAVQVESMHINYVRYFIRILLIWEGNVWCNRTLFLGPPIHDWGIILGGGPVREGFPSHCMIFSRHTIMIDVGEKRLFMIKCLPDIDHPHK